MCCLVLFQKKNHKKNFYNFIINVIVPIISRIKLKFYRTFRTKIGQIYMKEDRCKK